MDTTSNEPNSKSPIKFSECDFLRKSQETNKIETNEIRENRDEAINRHPALVRANLRSKSADLINETSTTKKTILKIKSNAYQERVTLDQDLIEQTTKMNTYLNSQIIHPKNGPSHVSRKKQSKKFIRNQNCINRIIINTHKAISRVKIYHLKHWHKNLHRTLWPNVTRDKILKSLYHHRRLFSYLRMV